MWHCPKCKYPNPDNLAACYKCGSTTTAIVYNYGSLSPSELRVWNNPGLHKWQSQQERQQRAASIDIIVDYVDDEGHVAKIRSFVTSLEECTCPDFEKRHLPCKHMYRLAHELGVYKLNMDPNTLILAQPAANTDTTRAHKHRITTALIAFLFGSFGLHRFYLRQPLIGLVYVIFFFLFIPLPILISFIECIVFAFTSDEAWQQQQSHLLQR